MGHDFIGGLLSSRRNFRVVFPSKIIMSVLQSDLQFLKFIDSNGSFFVCTASARKRCIFRSLEFRPPPIWCSNPNRKLPPGAPQDRHRDLSSDRMDPHVFGPSPFHHTITHLLANQQEISCQPLGASSKQFLDICRIDHKHS